MAAQRVLESGRVNYLTGEEGRAFEAECATYLGSRHAVALSNGTVALELAYRALGVGPGDDVIVPARTFIATAAAAVAVGARPVVADVDRDSGNITAETVAAAWTPDTKVVVVVHLGGWPAEMDDLQAVCAERGAHLVEDCAQAHGATYRGRQVGTFGRISTFSFCQDKIMTTAGEGGLVVTNDDDLARSMIMYKNNGTDPVLMAGAAESPAYKWIHADFGSN
ncbi:MAG: aminotransferase class V-fold PLP-dependent enzyme, partial [Gemmatimonadales bacterium]|nr:aminotransferase class V-fold PLP-dependent enzyme [Gemmatimonadales bacterium]